MAEGRVRETSITLTPAGDGRLEIYLNGRKVYDRKEAGAGDFYPALSKIRAVRQELLKELEAVPA